MMMMIMGTANEDFEKLVKELLINLCNFNFFGKRQESNPGRLGVKRKCCLCAMQHTLPCCPCQKKFIYLPQAPMITFYNRII